jgi:hypothetical protein
MVERYLINYDERGETLHPSGDFVHYEDYARLQEQLEAVTREGERWEKHATTGDEVLGRTRAKLEAAEARAAMLEAALRGMLVNPDKASRQQARAALDVKEAVR